MGRAKGSSRGGVAITGAAGFLGTSLLRRLADEKAQWRLLGLDDRAPDLEHPRIAHGSVDLASQGATSVLVKQFRSHDIDTVVHLCFLWEPTHRNGWAHELEAIGTLQVLNACAEHGVRKIVMLSTTTCYGAYPSNPNFLTEDHLLRAPSGCRFLDDKVEAERQIFRYRRERPGTVVTVLRMAPIVGPTVDNWVTRYLRLPVPMKLLGHDPLVQLLHEADALDALALAMEDDADGVFNITGHGVMRLSKLLRVCGRVPIALPEALARAVTSSLWMAQLLPQQPAFLSFLRYPCVTDGQKARGEMGFVPRYSTFEAAREFAGSHRAGSNQGRGKDS